MGYVSKPLTDHQTGTEVIGVDLTRELGNEIREKLNADLARHHVLVIRNQKFSTSQFLQAAKLFGDVMIPHRKSGDVTEDSSVFEIRNRQIAPGRYYIYGESFHTDHSNDPVPPKATSLFPVSLPSRGGDTQFVNMHHAYDDLPAGMKQRVDRLMAVHVYVSKYSPRPLYKLDDKSLLDLPPPAIHPLVRIHPQNGRKFLYLNPIRMESILGIPDENAQALIAELMKHATQPKYEYRHQWKYGDMVIWDNRSVMHQANGDYDMTELRSLYRIMIKGELHPSDIAARRGTNVEVAQRVPV